MAEITDRIAVGYHAGTGKLGERSISLDDEVDFDAEGDLIEAGYVGERIRSLGLEPLIVGSGAEWYGKYVFFRDDGTFELAPRGSRYLPDGSFESPVEWEIRSISALREYCELRICSRVYGANDRVHEHQIRWELQRNNPQLLMRANRWRDFHVQRYKEMKAWIDGADLENAPSAKVQPILNFTPRTESYWNAADWTPPGETDVFDPTTTPTAERETLAGEPPARQGD